MNALSGISAMQAATPVAAPTFAKGSPVGAAKQADQVADAQKLRDTYGQFVGETFYGSMLKAMRESVGEPAFFHGGRAERLMQSQLDQQMASDLASGSGADLAQSLFAKQFPDEAQLLNEHERAAPGLKPLRPTLESLNALRRL
ncbi:MAG: rod-binding protein [Lacipirellulaceae bacterium]